MEQEAEPFPIERDPTEEVPIPPPKANSSERLLKIAGVLDGWNIQEDDLEDLEVELYEDDDMKRTREARERAKKHRW